VAETDLEDDPLRTGDVRSAEAAEGRRSLVRGRFEGDSGAEMPSSSSEANAWDKATLHFAIPGVLLTSRRADFVGDADCDCGCEREGVLICVVVVVFWPFLFPAHFFDRGVDGLLQLYALVFHHLYEHFERHAVFVDQHALMHKRELVVVQSERRRNTV
jgi:hypothetical protein